MKKTYKMCLALMMMLLGAINVSAGDRVPLTNDMFYMYDGFGADANKIGPLDPANTTEFGVASGCPFGDTSCNAWLDCTKYAKLYIKMEGCDGDGVANGTNPRIFINRLETEGQFNADKSVAKCIVIPNAGTWAEDYYTKEDDGTYVIDLTKIKKDFGFAHLHSIKGSAWNTQAIVYSVEAEKADKSQLVGWVNMVENSDLEGEEVDNFRTRIYPDETKPVPVSEIVDGVGKDGSRGIRVAATARGANPWDNQFFIRFDEPVLPGAQYRISFDYKADTEAKASTQAHAEPADYIHYDMLGDVNFTTDWQTFTKEGQITADQSKPGENKAMRSIAFNLSEYEGANNYYFDNIKFEVYMFGTTAEYAGSAVLLNFGHETNIPELVKATGKKRMMFPTTCGTVKVDGSEIAISSVEAFADGRLYYFLNSAISRRAKEVIVSFMNPAEEAYHLVYTSGPNVGGAVGNFNGTASMNSEISKNEGYAYKFVVPTLVEADPENGSFNLPVGIKEFKVKFDKNADGAAMVATLDGARLTVAPAAMAEEFTLTREGADLANGKHTLNITKIYPEERLDDETFADTTYVFYTGKVEADPNDTLEVILPDTYFAEMSNGGVPEGFTVMFGTEERTAPNTYGSGARGMDFAAGGDFTKGVYFREGYIMYGNMEGYELSLKAGKTYKLHFTSAAWKGDDNKCRFEILNDAEEAVVAQVITNKPNVNGSTGVVKGATQTDIDFTPEMDGNYRLKWTNAADLTSDPSWIETLLANVSMKYIPNTVGVMETLALNNALENAKSVRDANVDERYDGAEYQALVDAITKYEAEKETYTNPSSFNNAVEVLNALAEAMQTHRANCDEYDTQVKKAIDVVRQNEMPNGDPEQATKFVATELFGQLKDIVSKYHGSSEWTKSDSTAVYSEENPEVIDHYDYSWVLVYSYDVLKDEAVLVPAIAELKEIANTTSLLFTEGESNCSDTGVKVAFERIRLGIEGLKSMGVAEDDEQIVEANKALTDDDNVVEGIKNRMKVILYNDLKEATTEMFKPIVDEGTLEETPRSYDVSVFIMNPNVYKLSNNTDYTDEAVPGWVVPEGYNRPGLSCGWGSSRGTDIVAEDCMFQTWGGSYRVEQTITDLPAGIYTLKIGFGERMQDDASSNIEQSFVYAKTSDTPAVEVGMEEDREANFAGVADCLGIGQSFPKANTVIEGLVVTDGILTIGANASQGSHTFFNDARLFITGGAPGVDYAAEYEEAVNGIESVSAAKVRAIQLYDLNGRRISSARQGLVIVKKFMSDGSVRIEKVIKK